jgi:hypothetical protein
MSQPRSPKRALCAATLALLAISSPALAQTSPEKAASAQALFDEGLRLMNAGQPASACPKLAASQKLDPGMGTKFRLAECYEKIGKTASAWALYIEIGDEARGAKRPDREKIARKRAEDLAPKLARMTVVVAPDTASLTGLEIRRDGTVLEKAIWDVPTPIDPGEHLLTATAPGKNAWESKAVVAEASKTVVAAVPRLEDAPKPVVAKAPAPVEEPVLFQKRSALPAVALGGVAVVAAGVGVAMLVISGSKKTQAINMVSSVDGTGVPLCSNADLMGHEEACAADTFHNAAVGLFVGAGVAGAAAVVYLLLPPPSVKTGPLQGLRATPILGSEHAALLLSGSF